MKLRVKNLRTYYVELYTAPKTFPNPISLKIYSKTRGLPSVAWDAKLNNGFIENVWDHQRHYIHEVNLKSDLTFKPSHSRSLGLLMIPQTNSVLQVCAVLYSSKKV